MASPELLVDFLMKFHPLSADAQQEILQAITTQELPKKTILLKSGKVCQHLYFLEKGLGRCFTALGDKEHTNDIVIDGEILTSFSSFITRQPSNETIELLEDCILHSIHYDNLQELYRRFPEVERTGRMMAEHYYISLAAQTHRLRYFSSVQRYQYLLENKPAIVRRAPLGVIASYLGMTLENLSRIRNKV